MYNINRGFFRFAINLNMTSRLMKFRSAGDLIENIHAEGFEFTLTVQSIGFHFETFQTRPNVINMYLQTKNFVRPLVGA